MHSQDPVTQIKLSEFVARSLAEAQSINGGPENFEALYLKNADPTVLTQLYAELKDSSLNV